MASTGRVYAHRFDRRRTSGVVRAALGGEA